MILNRNLVQWPQEVTDRVSLVVEHLTSNGIPFEDLGIYGGLQTFVVSINDPTHVKDIDIAVYGLQHVDAVKDLARESISLKRTRTYERVKAIDGTMRDKRHSLTRIYLPEGIFCDTKIIRKINDQSSYPRGIALIDDDTTNIVGRVVDAREALSTPTTYVVETLDGPYKVSANRYDFIAAADEGDLVQIMAAQTSDQSHALLLDASKHIIRVMQN